MIGYDDLPTAVDGVVSDEADRVADHALERARMHRETAPRVIERLELMLEAARRGEIVAIAAVTLSPSGEWDAGWSSGPRIPFSRMYAAIGGLKLAADEELVAPIEDDGPCEEDDDDGCDEA